MTTKNSKVSAVAEDPSTGQWWLKWFFWVGLIFFVIPGVFYLFSMYGFLGYFGFVLLLIVVACMAVKVIAMWRAAREKFILEAPLPPALRTALLKTYPHLSSLEYEEAELGLREFFLACHQTRSFMAMPSQAVDVLWHEFILDTKAYAAWCKKALGKFLHHTPAAAMGRGAKRNDALRRIWHWACLREEIDPRAPARLPNLFSIDKRLRIPDGFHYQPDCGLGRGQRDNAVAGSVASGGDVHCGSSFSDTGYSGSSGDFGGAESSSSSDGGPGSSDGGGGGDGGAGGCGGGGD